MQRFTLGVDESAAVAGCYRRDRLSLPGDSISHLLNRDKLLPTISFIYALSLHILIPAVAEASC